MNYTSIARKYIGELERTFQIALESGEATAELSYRPALDSFFRNIISDIDATQIQIIFEPKIQHRAGRPDWRFYHRANLGVFGFVEAKALDGASLIETSRFSEQINRYLALGQNLVLTDGIDFVFYLHSNNWHPQVVSLIQKPLPPNNWGKLEINPRLENLFREFFASPKPRHCSEEQLVGDIALRAARLSDEIASIVELRPDTAKTTQERKAVEKLLLLKDYLQSNHDPSLAEDKPFSDFVAQVLCFGLLYSHRVEFDSESTPAERYKNIHKYWIDGLSGAAAPLRPFQELVLQLRDELEPNAGHETILSTWYDDCRHLLSYIQLTDEQRGTPDYHKLYERFFEKFDAKSRFDFGAFYTPKELAFFVVSLVNEITKKAYRKSLFTSENKLIDPCCGTGTFIEQIIDQLPDDQCPTIVGFEILPAPYALAHYRLSQLTSLKSSLTDRIHILLTNTLSDFLDYPIESTGEDLNLFQKEQMDARDCASSPIIAVIGNPPSSDSTKAPHQTGKIYSRISGLIEDFRPPVRLRGSRQNLQKQLRNDFVRFLRWAVDRVSGDQHGIIALVIPESFLEHGSYRYARKWLTENFSFIWVMDIDADQRAKGSSGSLFNTLQGRALLVAARDNALPSSSVDVRYGSLTHLSPQEKRDRLATPASADNISTLFPETVTLDFLHRFRPSGTYNKELWLKSWPIYASSTTSVLPNGKHAVFVRHSSALKLGATSLLVHSDKALLQRRTKEAGDSNITFERLRENWFSGQSKPPTELKLRPLQKALKLASKKDNAAPYVHRPFVNLWAQLDGDVLTALTSMPGGGARTRPEVRSAFSTPNNLAFTIAPSRRDIGEDLHRFVSFCWGLPDNDLCRRGNAQVVCHMFPDYKTTKGSWNSRPHKNFDPLLLAELPTTKGNKEEALVYYCYAALCAPSYLEAFSGALFTTAEGDTIPRVPISGSASQFEALATIGQKLADLENPQLNLPLPPERLRLLEQFTPSDTMKMHSLRSTQHSEDKVILHLMDSEGSALFSTDPVGVEVEGFRVSGYSVLEEWVKWFSYRYARIPLRSATIEAFLQIVSKIEKQIELLAELDEVFEQVLDAPDTWLDCPPEAES